MESETSLISRQEYLSSYCSALDNVKHLAKQCDTNEYLGEYMGPLVLRLAESYFHFMKTEVDETFPTLKSVHSSLSSWDTSTELNQIQRTLDSKLAPLNRIIAAHTKTLSEVKAIENSAESVQSSLHSKALQMKAKGKDRKAGAAAAMIFGGLLAPFTGGGSLLLGAAAAKGLYDGGEDLMVEYRTLRDESAEALVSFSKAVRNSINIIEKVAILIRGLLEEVRSLSASQSRVQLRRASKKAENLRQMLSGFLELDEDLKEKWCSVFELDDD